MVEFTTSTASSVGDLTSAAALYLPFPPGSEGTVSDAAIRSQVVRVFGQTSSASLTVTCSLILVESTNTGYERLARFPFTVTSTAFRSPTAGGASGDYLATVAFTESGNSKHDLLGYGETVRPSTATAPRGTKTGWYVVVESGLSSGSITLRFSDTRAI